MKHLILFVSLLFVANISAQTLESVNANIILPSNATAMDGINSFAKTTACGPDTNGYALAKATGLLALNINNATSASAVSQYFDAPQAITISGSSFYGWKSDTINGITLTMTVEIYTAATDSTPTGAPLASGTVVIDTTFAPGTLDVLRKSVTFSSPITVTNPYVVVVSNNSPTPMSLIYNSWTAADGDQEWLSSALIGVNWLRSYNINVGGPLLDADALFEPHTTYDLSSNFLIDNLCNQAGVVSTFTNNSSPIVGNRMYNVAAFQALEQFSYTWDYGDGSPTENVINGSHTYAAVGPYTISLSDTIYGWTTNCADDTMATINVVTPTIASFTSAPTLLTVAFTNTSSAGTGATYSWDFGDGNTSVLSDPTHTYAADGTYTVCLTVTDACGAVTSCNPVTVGCPVPIPLFTASTTNSPIIDFTNSSTVGTGAMYLWDFGDGNTSTLFDPSHTYSVDGVYTVCLTVLDACGADSTCQQINVVTCNNPAALFTIAGASPTYTFTNGSTTTGTTTYAWDFGDGNTASTMDASHTYTSGGTFTVTLTVTDSCGSNTFTSSVVSTVGVDELTLADVSVYPNPSNGIFTIESSIEMEEAFITDISGKLIYIGELSGNDATIDASKFANGTYFLSIQFANDMTQTVRLEVVK